MSIPVPPVPRLPPAELTLTSLSGLSAAGVAAGIKVSGLPDVALLAVDRAVPAHALFTRNHFAAAPVQVSRAHLERSGGMVRSVLVTSGNANACTGEKGLEDAARMCRHVAGLVGCPVEQVVVCSTGVIGVPLPMDRVSAGIDAAFAALADDVDAGRRFLAAIMTTDAFPKEASAAGPLARTAGVCKGAGMIEPDMATMLALVATEGTATPAQLRAALPAVAARSFNAVHVDSHSSTNDTFLTLALGRSEAPWEPAVGACSHRLAWLIARDGEGATKVTTIHVRGASSDEAARRIARRVASSALVRTALFGNDPNWGRFTSQVGNAPEVVDASRLSCRLQGIEVFRRGEPTPFDRAAASRAMHAEDVVLELVLADGPGEGAVMTSDLSYRYVQVNAEYTT